MNMLLCLYTLMNKNYILIIKDIFLMASLKIYILMQTLPRPPSLTLFFSPYPHTIHDLIKVSKENCSMFCFYLWTKAFLFSPQFSKLMDLFLKKLV